ncbi:MAG: hypothetical protein KDM63_21455, partial [Verrucomicrobiae bacterium]|nr:hypothetical protein [Verrucomicrobiae bacterium]
MVPKFQNRKRSRVKYSMDRSWRAFSKGWDFYLFVVGYGLVFGLLGIAALALPDLPPGATSGSVWTTEETAPGTTHWFGLTHSGSDWMGSVLHGAGVSVWLALLGTMIGVSLGLLVGMLWGFLFQDRGERMLSSADRMLSPIPALVVVLALGAGWGTEFLTVAMMLGFLCAIPLAAKVTGWFGEMNWRGEVVAARAMGWTRGRLMLDQLCTRVWKQAAALAAMWLPGILSALTALDFAR